MTNAGTKPLTLHRIDIKSPCTASWAQMKGDERERHCDDCNKSVFNLSAMPEADAAALLANNTDGGLCVRFYRRPDGTVMTSDCSTSARAYAKRTLRKLPSIAGSALLAMSVAGCAGSVEASGQHGSTPVAMQGEPAGEVLMGAPPAVADDASPADQEARLMGKPSTLDAVPPAPAKG